MVMSFSPCRSSGNVHFARLLAHAALFGTLLQCGLILAQAADTEQFRVIDGHKPQWATRHAFVRNAHPDAPMKLLMDFGYSTSKTSITPTKYAERISDPRSKMYRKFLSPRQFANLYSVSAEVIAATKTWLTTHGFTNVHAPTNRKFVLFEGTVAQVESVFKTKLGYFRLHSGIELRAPMVNPSLPCAILDRVTRMSLIGLDEHGKLRRSPTVKRSDIPLEGKEGISPRQEMTHRRGLKYNVPNFNPSAEGCVFLDDSTSTPDFSTGNCNYSPAQLRSAYGVPEGLTGKNQTIAMLLWNYNPFTQSDLDQFSIIHGLTSTTIEQVFPPYNVTKKKQLLNNPPPPDFYLTGVGGEIALDTQIAHGMAPDAELVYVYAETNADESLVPALNAVLEFKLASILSNSWGLPIYGGSYFASKATNYTLPTVLQTYEELFIQAAIIGIGIYASTGDQGDLSHDTNALFIQGPEWPSVSPWVTGVGGTFLAIDTNNDRMFEIPWGYKTCFVEGQYYETTSGDTGLATDYQCAYAGVGGGGGVSVNFFMPYYQRRSKDVRRLLGASGHTDGRITPDISALADTFTGFAIVYSEYDNTTYNTVVRSIQNVGGTSLASPLIAAIVACAQEGASANGQPNFGFINPTLYDLPSRAFYDVVPGNVSFIMAAPTNYLGTEIFVFGDPGGLDARSGYDNATGLGTPGTAFIEHLNSVYT
eukprot:TRINITY_DN32965_c0_g1_i1.p1 TRINITY_DN32965_c0_g1~~TRINITY_DN32965_c0_g1_i1.p1  ORF type:complete len:705 (-),score=49.82 TRINITY_DN32965_c0_g1_i1:429-2543(-)